MFGNALVPMEGVRPGVKVRSEEGRRGGFRGGGRRWTRSLGR